MTRLRKLEDKFSEELSAQTRLANLYKAHSVEHNAKLEDLGKHFRQEKDIMVGRLEVSQAETARLQSQLDHQQRLVTESQSEQAALTDSNKMLREEKDRIEKENEDKFNTLLSEKMDAEADAEKWKKRSEELVEKSHKINLKELARLQEVEINLTKSVSQLEAEKVKLEVKVNSHSKEVDHLKKELEEEKKRLEAKNKKNIELKENSELDRENAESWKKKTRELTTENKRLKEEIATARLHNNNDFSVQPTLKRTRDSNQAEPVIKEEKYSASEDEDSSGRQKKLKSEFLGECE